VGEGHQVAGQVSEVLGAKQEAPLLDVMLYDRE